VEYLDDRESWTTGIQGDCLMAVLVVMPQGCLTDEWSSSLPMNPVNRAGSDRVGVEHDIPMDYVSPMRYAH